MFFFVLRNEVGSLLYPFIFLCLNLSDGNHSALHLLHLGQHSLDAGQDLVLVRRRGDADASHVSGRTTRGGEQQPFRTGDNNNKRSQLSDEGLIHMMVFTAFQWKTGLTALLLHEEFYLPTQGS